MVLDIFWKVPDAPPFRSSRPFIYRKKGVMYNKFLLTIPLYFWHSCFFGTIFKSKKMITFLETSSYPIQKSTARFESWIFRFETRKRWVPWILVPWSCRSSTSSPSLPEPPWPLSLPGNDRGRPIFYAQKIDFAGGPPWVFFEGMERWSDSGRIIYITDSLL